MSMFNEFMEATIEEVTTYERDYFLLHFENDLSHGMGVELAWESAREASTSENIKKAINRMKNSNRGHKAAYTKLKNNMNRMRTEFEEREEELLGKLDGAYARVERLKAVADLKDEKIRALTKTIEIIATSDHE